MILLDTNIISELMRPESNQAVITWLDEFTTHSTARKLAKAIFMLTIKIK